MNTPLISILISYYNDENYLKECIESIIAQTYQNWELLLLNHNSTDNSKEIALSFNDPRIHHIDYPVNLGSPSGLLYFNLYKQAKGKYIKIFSADDTIKTNGIEILVRYMEENPQIDFAFGNVEYINNKSITLNNTWFNSREKFSLHYSQKELLKIYFNVEASILPFAGQIIKKDILTREYFDSSLIMLFDIYLWFSLLFKGCKIGFIDRVVANYRIHTEQVSGLNKIDIATVRTKYEIEYYFKKLLDIRDYTKVKFLCCDSKYIKLANSEDCKFIIAEYLLNKHRSISAYIELQEMLNDDTSRMYLENKFNFNICTLRDLYSRPELIGSWRRIARIKTSNLKFIQVLYIVFFRIFLKPIKKFKEKKKYSL